MVMPPILKNAPEGMSARISELIESVSDTMTQKRRCFMKSIRVPGLTSSIGRLAVWIQRCGSTDAQLLHPSAEHPPIEDEACAHHGGEERSHDSDDERDGEALDGAGTV